MRLAPEVLSNLKYYVYIYMDPTAGEEPVPFYIGKGKGNRAFAHLDDRSETEKVERIRSIRAAGVEPRIDFLAYGLSEHEATLVETSAIDLLGLNKLTNRIRGHCPTCGGRITCEDLDMLLRAEPVRITDKSILININRCYRSGMTPLELYEATRGTWKVGPAREQVDVVMAVFQGVIREVYRVQRWLPAATLAYETRDASKLGRLGRWEFEGEIAHDVRERYYGKSIRDYLTKGSRNPIRYVFP